MFLARLSWAFESRSWSNRQSGEGEGWGRPTLTHSRNSSGGSNPLGISNGMSNTALITSFCLPCVIFKTSLAHKQKRNRNRYTLDRFLPYLIFFHLLITVHFKYCELTLWLLWTAVLLLISLPFIPAESFIITYWPSDPLLPSVIQSITGEVRRILKSEVGSDRISQCFHNPQAFLFPILWQPSFLFLKCQV